MVFEMPKISFSYCLLRGLAISIIGSLIEWALRVMNDNGAFTSLPKRALCAAVLFHMVYGKLSSA